MARPRESLPKYLRKITSNGVILWVRVCSKCNGDIKHKSYVSEKNCHKQNRLCSSCGCWNKGLTKKTNQSLRSMAKKVSISLKKIRKNNPPWNKGLTKENNDVLKEMGDNHIGFKHDGETKKLISEYSKKCWENEEYRKKCLLNLQRGQDEDIKKKSKEKIKKLWTLPEYENWRKSTLDNINKNRNVAEWRKTGEKNGNFTPHQNMEDFQLYKHLVWFYTRKNELFTLNNFNKRGHAARNKKSYHLDHKFSIKEGFKNKIPPEIIGSISNLDFIPWKQNIQKRHRCSITKHQLLKLYEKESKI